MRCAKGELGLCGGRQVSDGSKGKADGYQINGLGIRSGTCGRDDSEMKVVDGKELEEGVTRSCG